MQRRHFLALTGAAAACTAGSLRSMGSSAVQLALPTMQDGNHLYYHDLLGRAFAAASLPVGIRPLPLQPQGRLLSMLGSGEASIYWLLRTEERDRAYVPIEFPTTKGLIGQRILFIRPGEQHRFDNVQTLDDFRALGMVGGMGRGWLEAKLWRDNGLNVHEQPGNWRALFRMLIAGNRDIDYICRGATEIVAEAHAHPELAVERRLVLAHQREMGLYLSPIAAGLAPHLTRGLEILRDNGEHDALIQRYFGAALQTLDMPNRRFLTLLDGGPVAQRPASL